MSIPTQETNLINTTSNGVHFPDLDHLQCQSCGSDEQDNARDPDTLPNNKTCQLGERKINTPLETLNNLGITNAKELVKFTFGLGETEYWKIVDMNNIKIDPEKNVENQSYFKVVPKSNSMQFSANRGLPSDIEHITSM